MSVYQVKLMASFGPKPYNEIVKGKEKVEAKTAKEAKQKIIAYFKGQCAENGMAEEDYELIILEVKK